MSDETPLTIWIDDNGGEYRFRKFRMDMGPTPVPGWRAWRLLRGEAFDALQARAVAAEARVEEMTKALQGLVTVVTDSACGRHDDEDTDDALDVAKRALSRAKAGGA